MSTRTWLMALLQVFVENGCSGCRRAIALAEQVRGRFPTVRVEIVNLSEQHIEPPEAVFAVPTFLLDGEVLSLGNPRPVELMRKLGAGPGLTELGGSVP
ncbi:MAG: hypothetical protein AB7R89_01705 [Dehalococcoidia bacterium]